MPGTAAEEILCSLREVLPQGTFWIMKVKCNHKNGVQRTTECSAKLSWHMTDRHSGFRRSGFGRSGLDVRGLDVRG